MVQTYEHLIGHAFPGGTATVPRWMNRLWADAVRAEDPTPHVHPVLVYYAAVDGSGVSFQDIFDMMEGSAASGILFGSQSLEFREPIEVDRDYAVRGEVVDVVRKTGRKAGVFDLMTFRLTLTTPDDTAPVATSTSTFVFPRSAAA
jgi:hypothetical protein